VTTRTEPSWTLGGMAQDEQSITRDWQLVNQSLIAGVRVQPVQHVPTGYGYLTELYRADWKVDDFGVDQVFQGVLDPGRITAWHAHGDTTDRLFVSLGLLKIVLYDAREDSPTHRVVNQFRVGTVRPALLVVPPGVWHGVENVHSSTSILVNIVDHAYRYERPDHYRLPHDTEKIPYDFATGRVRAPGRVKV
jgi:dTDP-4-dehydrorhamnose 3,5-epimerase